MRARRATVLVVLLVLPLLAASGEGDTTRGMLPTHVREFRATSSIGSFAAFAQDGQPLPPVEWRIVKGVGNCCENYLATTASGRILNAGGSELVFSDDAGASWYAVTTPAIPLGGEGAVAAAPNGDVVAAIWDAYAGDRLVTIKYDAAADAWASAVAALHTPFFDRPWIAVAPGEHAVGGSTAPYLAILKGGWPSQEVWYESFDGLHYLRLSTRLASDIDGAHEAWIPSAPGEAADVAQPAGRAGIFPVSPRGALAARADWPYFGSCDWRSLGEDLAWRCTRLADGQRLPVGILRVDSLGRAHLVREQTGGFRYSVSEDGGATWRTRELALPAGLSSHAWDFVVRGSEGVAAIAVHAHRASNDTHQDLVLRIEGPALPAGDARTQLLGRGDMLFGASAASSGPRFDFPSVAILPGGRIVASFADSQHTSPAVAIER